MGLKFSIITLYICDEAVFNPNLKKEKQYFYRGLVGNYNPAHIRINKNRKRIGKDKTINNTTFNILKAGWGLILLYILLKFNYSSIIGKIPGINKSTELTL